MKKFLIAMAIVALSVLGLASPASATNGGHPGDDNKKVTLCHYDGSNEHGGSGKYSKITVSVMAFYNSGHINHSNDIWEAFSYTTVGGDVVNVPAQGNTALLAFDDCEQPKVDTQIAKPDVTYADECGTENDVFAVPSGEGYTVSPVAVGNSSQSITVTLNQGFTWPNGDHEPVTFTRPLFTNVDCGLPDTGMGATYNTTGGLLALAGVLVGGGLMLARRRRMV